MNTDLIVQSNRANTLLTNTNKRFATRLLRYGHKVIEIDALRDMVNLDNLDRQIEHRQVKRDTTTYHRPPTIDSMLGMPVFALSCV